MPAIAESEFFIRLLVGSRRARGAGALLLAHATQYARAAGVSQLRVDCYAGGTGALVNYYQRQGFVKTDTFDVNGWSGQILSKALNTTPAYDESGPYPKVRAAPDNAGLSAGRNDRVR